MKKTFTAPEMSISKFACENVATNGSTGTTAVNNVDTKLDNFARDNKYDVNSTALIF